jgi:hypothetical protein
MSSLQTTTLLVTRGGFEIEVEVTGLFCKGEKMTLESPSVPGSVEFESAFFDGKPFELTDEEIKKAEQNILDCVYDNASPKMRSRWVI